MAQYFTREARSGANWIKILALLAAGGIDFFGELAFFTKVVVLLNNYVVKYLCVILQI